MEVTHEEEKAKDGPLVSKLCRFHVLLVYSFMYDTLKCRHAILPGMSLFSPDLEGLVWGVKRRSYMAC